MTKTERIEQLEREIAELRARIAALEARPAVQPLVIPVAEPRNPWRDPITYPRITLGWEWDTTANSPSVM